MAPRWSGCLALLVLLSACGDRSKGGAGPGGEAAGQAQQAGPTKVLSAELILDTWPVKMAEDEARRPFEARSGWASLMMQRDFKAALGDFTAGEPEPMGQARVHLELAAAYRSAARLGAEATVSVYQDLRRDEDPDQVDCLLGVSLVLLGRYDEADARLAACGGLNADATTSSAAAWRSWLGSGRSWPPAGPLGATPGHATLADDLLPEPGEHPHYRIPDRVEGLEVRMADPGALLRLSLFHEDAARAAGADAAVVGQWLAPWRLPVEEVSVGQAEIPTTLLFGSTLLSSADAGFLAAIAAGEEPGAAMASWSGSPLVAVVEPCVSGQDVDVGCVLERAGGLFNQLQTAMEVKGGGPAGFHRPFAELGRLGALRAAEMVAEALGAEEAMGLLRLNAKDLSVGPSADPAYLLRFAAWDAGNRNAARAQELLHAQVGHLPGVELARYPLDALHVRLSRESAPGVPMH